MTQKWNLQDIRPAQPRQDKAPRRSISSDINPLPDIKTDKQARSGTNIKLASTIDRYQSDIEENSYSIHSADITTTPNNKSRRNFIVGLSVFLFVMFAGVTVSIMTGGAEISIYPKVREINVNAEFTAYSEKKPGELAYEIMTLDQVGERQVKASGQETVTKQATGEIEISKSTPGSERLIKNTRFMTESGLVFRIQESVVIPGATKDSSGSSVPGSVRAKVFADEAGDKYNIAAGTTLNVPGFKEGGFTELYNAISAKSSTAFTDGFDGPKFIINETELSTARESLQNELRASLLEKLKSESPADFTRFESAIAVTFSELPPTQFGQDQVTIKEKAILQIPLFKKEDFAKFVTKETVVGYDNEPVRIDNIENLAFSYSIATTSDSNIAAVDSLTFKIAGDPKIVWTFDSEKMKAELIGKEKTAFNAVLSGYTGIERGEVEVRPFWKRSFPDSLSDIKINEIVSTEN